VAEENFGTKSGDVVCATPAGANNVAANMAVPNTNRLLKPSALPARNNNGKSWQLLYQPIRTLEHALTAGLIPAEVFSFALFVVALRS
jgi:hypothetical protein